MIKILDNLTRYELLVIEQYCIDLFQPELNINMIVNIGGLPNKGATGYKVSEQIKAQISANLMGRNFSFFI
jgi:hypothetical protein